MQAAQYAVALEVDLLDAGMPLTDARKRAQAQAARYLAGLERSVGMRSANHEPPPPRKSR